jgi:flagellar L-ring protein precursor FlgH
MTVVPAATAAATTARSRHPVKFAARLIVLAVATATLPACNTMSRLGDVGSAPSLTQISDPVAQPGYHPVSLPMPAPVPAERNPNSLWRTGAKAFFKDQRAHKVGDIMTVEISINDQAQMSNKTARNRSEGENVGTPNFLGLQNASPTGMGKSTLQRMMSGVVNGENLVDLSSKSSSSGDGQINRKDQIDIKVAAIITQTLPNGNLVIQGHQEVRVNFELRELIMSGVIRPEDITSGNTIRYDQIAEARISYGGRGQITDVQQPRYGQQIFDIIFPF